MCSALDVTLTFFEARVNKKNFFYIKIWFFLFPSLSSVVYPSFEHIDTSSKSVLLINTKTKRILYEREKSAPLFPASTTKIATLLYILSEHADSLDKTIIADKDSLKKISPFVKVKDNYSAPSYRLETDGSSAGIQVGEKYSLRTLLYATMLASGNDAANLAAKCVSGSIPKFMEELNSYLQRIGCKNTHFTNPHGLNHPEHVTTAEDLATISSKAMEIPLFRGIVQEKSYPKPYYKEKTASKWFQRNQLLKKGKFYYPFATGIKTGYTSQALHNLVASAKKEQRELIAIILGCPDKDQKFSSAIKLFEEAFRENVVNERLIKKDSRTFSKKIQGADRILQAQLTADVSISYYPSEKPEIQAKLLWQDITLPIKQGQHVGYVSLVDIDTDLQLGEYPIYALENTDFSLLYTIKNGMHALYQNHIIKYGVLTACGALLTFYLLKRKKRRYN